MGDGNSKGIYGDEAWQCLLRDPRLAGMRIGETRVLRAEQQPETGRSRFFKYRDGANFQYSSAKMVWENLPWNLHRVGNGYGFSVLTERPLLKEDKPTPKRFPDAWVAWGHFICSEKFVNVLLEFDEPALEYVPIDYIFGDGGCPNSPYYFLDIIRRDDYVDWLGTNVNVTKNKFSEMETVTYSRLATKVSFSPLISDEVHILRSVGLGGAYFSKEIIEKIRSVDLSGPDFHDPAL